MNPTRTNRRHFFVLEGTNDIDTLSRTLISSGLRMSANDSLTYTNESVQLMAQVAPSESNTPYIGGCIFPRGGIIQRFDILATLTRGFGVLFLGFMVLYLIGWILAFILTLTSPYEPLMHIALTIGYSFLIAMICACFIVVTGFGGEYYATRYNLKTMEALISPLLLSFQHFYPTIMIHSITVRTSVGSCDILRHLPSDFVEQINKLDFGEINELFWRS